jgi:hypothetical protein
MSGETNSLWFAQQHPVGDQRVCRLKSRVSRTRRNTSEIAAILEPISPIVKVCRPVHPAVLLILAHQPPQLATSTRASAECIQIVASA